MIRAFVSQVARRGAASRAPMSALAAKSNTLTQNPLTSKVGGVRHAGVSVLGCGMATIALGGCAGGMGQIFAALVVGTARNPSMKDDLFTYTMLGLGFVELLAIVAGGIAIMLLYSE